MRYAIRRSPNTYKVATSPEGDKSLVPLEIEPAANDAPIAPTVEVGKPDGLPAASAQCVPTYSIVSMHISFSNGMELSLCETDVNEITALLHKIVG